MKSKPPTPTKSFFLAACIVGITRVLLAVRPETVLHVSQNESYTNYYNREMRARHSGEESPTVLILGTSRLELESFGGLADLLGIPRERVANYSQAGNSFWLNHLLLRRNPALLENTKVVIIDVLPYQLFQNLNVFPESDECFLRYATWEERLRAVRPSSRLIGLADPVLGLWSEPREPLYWARGAIESFESPDESSRRLREEVSTSEWRKRLRVHEFPREWLRDGLKRLYFPDGPLIENQLRALRGLPDLLPERSALVYLMLPLSDEFRSEFMPDERSRKQLAELETLVRENAGPRAIIDWKLDQAASGLAAEDYLDGVHFTASGFNKVTAILEDVVRRACPDGF